MGPDWKEWSRGDILYGIVAPLLVVLLIVAFSQVGRLVGGGFEGLGGLVFGLTMELQELLLIAAIPLTLGLVWNRWAGGASGFLMGMFYMFYWADTLRSIRGSGPILLAYILSPMLMGYIAGALNKHSENFKRILISGVLAAAIGGIMLFGIYQLSSVNVVLGIEGFLLTVLPRMLVAVVMAVVAKVFMWYGVVM
ncbi:MAG TPA: hypothetical protein VF893_06950, partial [Candidatus Bathyarchaeia archaeon]